MPARGADGSMGVVAANLLLQPRPSAASAPGAVSLADALPALLALALAFGVGSLVLRHVVRRMRQACQAQALVGHARFRASSDAHLQGLQGLLFHLQAVHELLPGQPAEARRALERALGAGDGMVASLLEAARAAGPLPGLADLADALGRMASELAGRGDGGLQLRVLARGRPRRMPRAAQEGLLLAAREALSNALRHSRGHRVELELSYLRRCLRLRVRDDGVGLDPGTGPRQRAGLATICNIGATIGARVEVRSRARGGTALTITLPWARAGADGCG
jgi:signal transduction histidine kinase